MLVSGMESGTVSSRAPRRCICTASSRPMCLPFSRVQQAVLGGLVTAVAPFSNQYRESKKGEIMRPSKRVLVALALGVPTLAAIVLAPVVGLAVRGAAAAPRGHTLYAGASAGTNASCASPGFTSVQTAVDAATDGTTVYLCGTTPYAEQVIIANKSLTLTGDAGASITAPSAFPGSEVSRLPAQFAGDNLVVPQAIVVIWGGSANVTIDGLAVSGPLPGNGGCAEQEFGVLVLGGASATLTHDQVLNAQDSNAALNGCQFGVGIQVGRRYWPRTDFSAFLVENFIGHASISDTAVSGYAKNGITVDGPGSTADLRAATVTGGGRHTQLGDLVAQNGIQISRGATGSVRDSTVSGNTYSGPLAASSTGILVYGGCGDPLAIGVQLVHNTLANNDIGVALNNYSADCTGPATSATQGKATNNTISDDAVSNMCQAGYTGCGGFVTYQVGINDVGNGDKLDGNKISGIGYLNAANDPANGIYILPIDSGISFPNDNAKIHGNQTR
jgi:hypothetical protein